MARTVSETDGIFEVFEPKGMGSGLEAYVNQETQQLTIAVDGVGAVYTEHFTLLPEEATQLRIWLQSKGY